MKELFDFQRSLMDKLAPVERELGYTPPPIPLDFTLRPHQDWFRLMSWYLTEEIVETLTATQQDRPEELADCLHFAIELCILAGINPEDYGRREYAAKQLDMFVDHPWQYHLRDVLIDLGRAVNLLKAKHWKRKPQPVNLERFQDHLFNMLFKLVQVIRGDGLKPEEIYMAKHQKNEERIKTKY